MTGTSLYLTDTNGTLYLAEQTDVWVPAKDAPRSRRPDDVFPPSVPLYRLTVQES